MVFARGVGRRYARLALKLRLRISVIKFVFRGGMVMVEGCIPHGHQLREEEDEHCHKGDAFDPWILGNGAGEAWIRKSFIGGSEEVDECGCEDDAGTEVFGDEEAPFRDPDALVSGGIYGECSACIKAFSVRSSRCGSKSVPNREPTKMTKMAEIRIPIRPSNPLPASHESTDASAAMLVMLADGTTCLATTRDSSCRFPMLLRKPHAAGFVDWQDWNLVAGKIGYRL